MASRIENAVVTFSKNIEAVNQLADLDHGLIDQTIQQLRERDARLKTANVDNPRLLAGNTLTNLENIRRNDSLRPGFQALVNQSAVLLASYFASGVSQLFRSAIAGALEHGPSKILEQHELKFTVRDVKNMGGDIIDGIPDLIAEGPGMSFQDTKSIQRIFKDYLDIDIPRDEVTNDVSVELALRHVLVHNGGIVDRKATGSDFYILTIFRTFGVLDLAVGRKRGHSTFRFGFEDVLSVAGLLLARGQSPCTEPNPLHHTAFLD